RGDEDGEFSRRTEIGQSGEQANGGEPRVTAAGQQRGPYGKQRSPDAVADSVYFALGDDAGDRSQGIQEAELHIIIDAEIAVGGALSRLRNTTLPGVTATSLPTLNCSVPPGGAPPRARCASSSQFFRPRMRLWPDSATVLLSSSGFVWRKFAGDAASSSNRPAK